ncbi:MAG: hypothetical protein Greene041619_992 [Candidatus Peregrinibacteria bacterium Greene0416_19]|nr:MAG: hypothetical protein Greene041619_992 [Candidatus Peregrinibacteria bacterium Greene0416_19]
MHSLQESLERLSSRQWLLLVGALFLITGLLVYGRAVHYDFVELDDALLIYENPKIQGYTLQNLRKIFTTYDPELYIPITLLSYQIDYAFGGTSPFVYHLDNLLLHIINALLFTVFARQVLKKRWVALICGFLFLVHPLHSEAAVWASARKDTLSTLFFLLSVLAYVWHARSGRQVTYVISLIAFALGLMSKVSIIPLPIVLFLFDYLDRRRFSRCLFLNKIPYVCIAILFGIVAIVGKAHVERPPFTDLLLMWVKSVAFFIQKILWPTGFSILYPFDGAITLRSPAFYGPLLLLLALLGIIAVAFLRRRRFVVLGVSFYLLTLAPSLYNLAKFPDYYITSDRYAYVPSIGLFLLAGAGLLWLERAATRVLALAIVLALAVVTFLHIPVWRNHEVLAQHVLSIYPRSRIAWMDLGNALRDRGDVEGAHRAYNASLAIRDDPRVNYNKALLLEMEGKPDDAIPLYEHAISLSISYDLARINLGRLYYERGRRADAREQFEKAAHYAPHLAMPHFNLGVLAMEDGSMEEAERFYRRAIDAEPRFADARVNLIVMLLKLGKTDSAVRELQQAFGAIPGEQRFRAMRDHLIAQGVIKK